MSARRRLTRREERHIGRLKRLRQGLSNAALAARFGVSTRLISEIPARGPRRELVRKALEPEGDRHLQEPLPLEP